MVGTSYNVIIYVGRLTLFCLSNFWDQSQRPYLWHSLWFKGLAARNTAKGRFPKRDGSKMAAV